MPFNHSRRFQCPVHGLIELTPLEAHIVSTPIFRRLQNIRQLGMTYLVYPSLGYSRYEHSIGACHTMGRILDAIEKNAEFLIPAYERQLYRVAALLHDIGHYPFSHVFESAIQRSDPSGEIGIPHNHEALSIKLIETAAANHPNSIGYALSHIDRDDLISILKGGAPACHNKNGQTKKRDKFYFENELHTGKKPERKNSDTADWPRTKYFHTLLKSDVDCDRIDYLARASLHSGTKYASINMDYIINSFTLDDKNIPCLDPKATSAVDQLLISRYLEHRQVYFHSRVASTGAMMQTALASLLDHRDKPLVKNLKKFISTGNTEFWQSFDDISVLAMLREPGNSDAIELQTPLVTAGTNIVTNPKFKQPPSKQRPGIPEEFLVDMTDQDAGCRVYQMEALIKADTAGAFDQMSKVIFSNLETWVAQLKNDHEHLKRWPKLIVWSEILYLGDLRAKHARDIAESRHPNRVQELENFRTLLKKQSDNSDLLPLAKIKSKMGATPLVLHQDSLLNTLWNTAYACVRVFAPASNDRSLDRKLEGEITKIIRTRIALHVMQREFRDNDFIQGLLDNDWVKED
jgi:HD superfamily phosphohydrolase